MNPETWDWSLRVFDHVDVHASDHAESVRFYETVLAPLGIPKLVERREATCFTNLNVVDRRPPTQNLHVCLFAREKERRPTATSETSATVQAPRFAERRYMPR